MSPSRGFDPASDPLLPDLIEITNRLASEGVSTIGHEQLWALVWQCRAEISGASFAALPELVERLARQRLITGAEGP